MKYLDSKTSTLWAAAVGPDQDTGGSGVGQRLIPAIILNLGMLPNWQPIDLSTMIFPAEFKMDYVRVYQRKGQTNMGCNPKNYPTADYITDHLEAYTSMCIFTF
ncbi:SKN1-domain-containing protein [Phlegmacium glaucopus]|nr:SKN1-domain-containing protein [Phlegmacium glaucopus]